VRIASPIELYPERRMLLGAWGRRPRGWAPLSRGERRCGREHRHEHCTAEQLPHTDSPPSEELTGAGYTALRRLDLVRDDAHGVARHLEESARDLEAVIGAPAV